MCRFFAVRSEEPVSLAAALCEEPTALAVQSRCDLRGECHGQGWGIATYDSQPRVVRATTAAFEDPLFVEHASSLRTTLALAHVRQASVGGVSRENTHPFVYGRWIFAHNGTLEGFATGRSRLLDATPPDLRGSIAGSTDSEHAFMFWLGRLRTLVGDVNGAVTKQDFASSLAETVQVLADWFPDLDAEQTRLNFLVTNGDLLAVTRWNHSLSILQRSGQESVSGNGDHGPKGRAVLIASEPTTREAWSEVPDQSLIIVDASLDVHLQRLG